MARRWIRGVVMGVLLMFAGPYTTNAQVDESKIGAWYMYIWSAQNISGNWGLQGDVQLRNWNMMGDLHQLLIRGGVTYRLDSTKVKFTAGYAHIQIGDYGSAKNYRTEHRFYEEAILPQKIGRFYLRHRFRYEQRFVEDQNFRTRYRYNFFMNIPLNKQVISPGTVYLALYNELFINGQRNIGYGKTVEVFDRNRAYSAVGYHWMPGLKIQAGLMLQTTNTWEKAQWQLSVHQKF